MLYLYKYHISETFEVSILFTWKNIISWRYSCCKNLGISQWRLSPERRHKEHHLVLNISVASKEEGLLKAFLFVSWWKTDDTMGGWGKSRGASKFFGVVVGYNHCRTIPPSLLAGTLPVPLFTPRVLSLFLFRSLLFSSTRIPPASFVFRLAALSLSAPMGLRGQHGGISDQFFKPRVPRLYTSWETTLGWVPAQSETSTAASLSGAGTSAWCRDRNEGEIKPRRKLKRGTEGSWKDRGQDAHTSPSLPSASPRDAPTYFFTNLALPLPPQHPNTSLLLAFRLSFPGRIVVARKRRDCSSSYVRALSFHLSLPSFTLSYLNFFRTYIPSIFIVRARSIFIM